MTALRRQGLSVSLGGRCVVDGVNLEVGSGDYVGLVRPNGAGKSTLLRAALGLQRAQGQSSLAALAPAERALAAAWLPQNREIAWSVSVETLAALGPGLQRRGGPLTETDHAAIDQALEDTDMLARRTPRRTRSRAGSRRGPCWPERLPRRRRFCRRTSPWPPSTPRTGSPPRIGFAPWPARAARSSSRCTIWRWRRAGARGW